MSVTSSLKQRRPGIRAAAHEVLALRVGVPQEVGVHALSLYQAVAPPSTG